MRQRSFAGPILLIGIGAFFLLNNLRPDLPILSMLSTYWPFVLIGWGLFRLAEILNWHTQGRPLPRFGISGGEWTLAIVLTVVGTSVLYGGRMNHNWPRGFRMRGLEMLGEPFDYPLSGSKMAKTTTPRVIIESFRGNVRIVGTDSNEVKVSGSQKSLSWKIINQLFNCFQFHNHPTGSNTINSIRRQQRLCMHSDLPVLKMLSLIL